MICNLQVIVNRPEIIEATLRAKYMSEHAGSKVGSEGLPPSVLREFNQRVLKYQRMYVTLQDDGSEDDLSYIKL